MDSKTAIDVSEALRAVPRFDGFRSVDDLLQFVESLRRDPVGLDIEVAGRSANGIPIHHISYGTGSVKALFVGYPHCDEPIGGLTVLSLLTLLKQRHPAIANAEIEWHIVPCIDPDGARLNEGWSQKAFTLENYMRNFHKQEYRDQVECSFPINYKQLVFDRPTVEAKILAGLLDRIRPDFYYSLHNAWAGGAFYFLTRDIDHKHHQELYRLLEQHRIPLQVSAPHRAWCAEFGEGIYAMSTTRNLYDLLERSTSSMEEALPMGACSWEYLAQIKERAMAFVTELPYLKHPWDGSRKPTTQSTRQLKLRMDAENKFVAAVIMEEWEKTARDLEGSSPFYKKIFDTMISSKDKLPDGLPSWPYKTRDLLFNPSYAKAMTEGERFNVYVFDRFYFLCHSYEFVRLLHVSKQTPAVRQAIDRLESVFSEALEDLAKNIDFSAFEVIDCTTLACVQLGSGLIVLRSLLQAQPS
jgi:hypothetical protein